MELVSLPIAIFASVAAALLSRRLGSMWLRAALVVAVAYAASLGTLALVTAGQFNSWAPVLLHFSFGVASVVGLVVLAVSYWLLKPRRLRDG